MTTKQWSTFGVVLVALAGLAGTAACSGRSADRPGPVAANSNPAVLHEVPAGSELKLRFFREPAQAPKVAMRDINGQLLTPERLSGKVIIVNFWATWCPPCRAEIPDLVALQARYGDQLQVIGVSQDEAGIDVVKRFAEAQHMNYPIVMSTPEIEKGFPGIAALPTSFIVDPKGRIVSRHVGMLNAVMTEQETRALSGLPVSATIEEVDPAQPAKLENAQVTQIPGVDLTKLSAERRMAAVQKLNTDPCTCGCENTVAKCRVDDPKCATSLPLAERIVADIAASQ